MEPTTVGQLLMQDALPKELHQAWFDIGKSSIKDVLRQVAEKYPDKYKDVLQRLMTFGHHAALTSGASVSLSALRQPPEVRVLIGSLRKQIDAINDSDTITDEDKDKRIEALVVNSTKAIRDGIYNAGIANSNPFALQAASGSRGNASQLMQLVAGQGLVMDAADKVIPVPILHGYAEGLDPAEYFAASYGARKGTVSTKFATQEAGFFGKQLAQSAHRLVVTADDCGTTNGIPVTAGDADNVGAVLAHSYNKWNPGRILDAQDIKSMKDTDQEIMVRSPITCQAPEGVCAKCAGVRDKGRLPSIGDNVGMTAAQSVSEKISQGMLCLAEGTMVLMQDMSRKPIEEVQVDDWVYTDAKNELGELTAVRVSNVFDNGKRRCSAYRFGTQASGSVTVTATPDHHILTDLGMRKLGRLWEGVDIATLASGAGLLFLGSAIVGEYNTYDIEVDHPNHRFVLEGGLVVSNSVKHSGGQVGSGGANKSGFNYVNQLVQVPRTFAGAATLAEEDGLVGSVDVAPQGGHYVSVGKSKLYVPSDQQVTVRPGSQVEAGDSLSDGTPNPAEVVRLKGIGQGRLSLLKALMEGFTASGIRPHRRQVEMLSRSLANHVKITDPTGFSGFLPDDVVSFDEVRNQYQPREGFQPLQPGRALNKYLERQVNQYTVGTRITPSIVADMNKRSINSIDVHNDPPPFEPMMVRAMEAVSKDSNWQTRFYGSYNRKSFMEALHRGRTSKRHDTSFVPAIVEGEEFGDDLTTTGKY